MPSAKGGSTYKNNPDMPSAKGGSTFRNIIVITLILKHLRIAFLAGQHPGMVGEHKQE